MTSSAAVRPAQLAVRVVLTGGIQTFCRAATKLRGLITGALTGSYQPELTLHARRRAQMARAAYGSPARIILSRVIPSPPE